MESAARLRWHNTTRFRLLALVVVGLMAGVTTQVVQVAGAAGPPTDLKGRPFDDPGIPVENGRVRVAIGEDEVGWADVYEVFGPPAGSYDLDELPPVTPGPPAVYDRSDKNGRQIGRLGPAGYVPTGSEGVSRTVTTTVSGDDVPVAD